MDGRQPEHARGGGLQGQDPISESRSVRRGARLPAAANAADNRKIGRLDTVFAYLGLTVYCGAIGMPFRVLRDGGLPKPGESDPVVAICQTLILGILTCIFISRWRRLLPLLRLMKPYLLIIALSMVSALWSDFPLLTARRTTTLAISLLFGVYVFQTFGLARLCRMFEGLAIALGVVSVIVYIVMPSIGRDSSVEDYEAVRGVFAQKNLLGECSLYGFLCCAYRFTEQRRMITFMLPSLLLFGCIALSHSVSAMLIALILLCLTVMSALRTRPITRMIYTYVIVSAGLVLLAIMIFSPDLIFAAIGRDSSLTGRVPLWASVLTIIAERPILGHGYAAFYNADSVNLQYLWLQFPWQPPGSHSGYLDMMVDLGIVGLLLYLWLFISVSIVALRAQFAGTAPLARWVSFFVLITMLMNIDESPSMAASIFTALMPSAMLEVALWKARRSNTVARPSVALTRRGVEAG
jgi:O-antigen ligase